MTEYRNLEDLSAQNPADRGVEAPSLDSIDRQIRALNQRLDRFIIMADQSLALGRDLVEARAANLDLKRQVHRLEEELAFAKAGGIDDPRANGTIAELVPEPEKERRKRSVGRLLSGLFRN